jgi:hypothetical protein
MEEIIKYAKGNPGALNFLLELFSPYSLEYALPIIIKIEEIPTLRGSNLYVLWSHLCNKDLSKVSELCKKCPSHILEDACSRQDYSGRELVAEYM